MIIRLFYRLGPAVCDGAAVYQLRFVFRLFGGGDSRVLARLEAVSNIA